jgi:hypothetical protein
MRTKQLRSNASAAITTVLILGFIASLVATLMLFQSTDNVLVAKILREGKKAEYAAMACGEIALEKLRLSTAYVGNETLTVSGTQTCTIGTITNISAAYTIPVSATNGESTKRLRINVSSINTSVNISGWEEVAN